jgi:hypothetical protein
METLTYRRQKVYDPALRLVIPPLLIAAKSRN